MVSLFTERWCVRKWTAIALLLGALGAVVATWSGNNAKETVGVLAESAETLLDHHEELAETTRNIAFVAAVLGLVAAFANLRGKLLRVARVTTAVVSLVGVYYVVQTGHIGGQLVYKHGVGLSSSVQSPNSAAPGSAERKGGESNAD